MTHSPVLDSTGWFLLLSLSVLWGGSFFFAEVALAELPPLTVVALRVVLAAAILLGVAKLSGYALPRSIDGWRPYFVMGMLNNALPFSLIVTGQTFIPSGLASILNATTPLFAVVVLAVAGDERLSGRTLAGVVTGFTGVVFIAGGGTSLTVESAPGMLCCIGAAASYGLAAWWGKRRLGGSRPLLSSTCQLVSSSIVMFPVALLVDRPWDLPMPGVETLLSVAALAVLSTALAYLLFFSVLVRAGPTNVSLVTLLVPVTAVMLGVLVLRETLSVRDVVGAAVIGAGLLVLDGRLVRRVIGRSKPA